jgi:hypothetical protein
MASLKECPLKKCPPAADTAARRVLGSARGRTGPSASSRFELQLVWLMQDKLSAAVGDALLGAALDRLLVEQKALLEAEATAAISQMMAA